MNNVAKTYMLNLLVQGASHWRPSGVIVGSVLDMTDGYRIKTIKEVGNEIAQLPGYKLINLPTFLWGPFLCSHT